MYQLTILNSVLNAKSTSQSLALYFQQYLNNKKIAHTEIIDVPHCKNPMLNAENQKNPLQPVYIQQIAQKLKKTDGVIIITPEYQNKLHSGLKNMIELLPEEWYHMPVAIVSFSTIKFYTAQSIAGLQFTLWEKKAWVIGATYPVVNPDTNFDFSGNAKFKIKTDQQSAVFIHQLTQCIQSKTHPQMIHPKFWKQRSFAK